MFDGQKRVQEQVVDGFMKADLADPCTRNGRTPAAALRSGLDDLRLAVDIIETRPPRPKASA